MLLLCTVWAMAQSYPSGQGSKDSSSSSGKTTVEGCLSRSDSGYTLTDKSGTTYQLTGDTSQLGPHVGHEVKIKGTTAEARASATSSTGASSQSEQRKLDVASMKHISETCSSTKGKSDMSNPSSTEKPPMSEKQPMSEKPPTSR
jgi:hypothetical protein